MILDSILAELHTLKNAATEKHNLKSGIPQDRQIGVKMGDLRKIAVRFKNQHELAIQLWDAEILETQLLACLCMDPKKLSAEDLTQLLEKVVDSYVTDWFSSYILKEHPAKESLRMPWLKSSNKWAVRLGWSITAGRISKHDPDIDIPALLDELKRKMPTALPEIQWTMNTALAYIGIYLEAYREQALALANEMGIYKDYPVSKGCVSPFAPIWIDEMVKRQKV